MGHVVCVNKVFSPNSCLVSKLENEQMSKPNSNVKDTSFTKQLSVSIQCPVAGNKFVSHYRYISDCTYGQWFKNIKVELSESCLLNKSVNL